MISVVALDLDDTLLRSDKSISPRTLELLYAWHELGRYVVIATGRPPRIAREIPDALHRFPLVCYNGAEILECNRSTYRNMMSAHEARQVISQVQQQAPKCWIGLESNDQLTANMPTDRIGVLVAPDLVAAASEPAAKIILRYHQCQAFLPHLNQLPTGCKILVSEKYDLVQIMSRSADKAVALQVLVERWGLGLGNVAAFGDDTNDVEMVRSSGLGVAVDNAVPEVRAVANRITGTNDEDGVSTVLEELIEL